MEIGNIAVNTLVFDEKLKDGIKQHELLEDIRSLGLKKVEIRREYIKDDKEFELIKNTAEKLDMEILYSIPCLLFAESMLGKKKMKAFFKEAERMKATHIKMTGGFAENISQTDSDFINSLLKESCVTTFTIENDQTISYATGEKLYHLAKQLRDKSAEVSITFDIGNFVYVNEDPVKNADLLRDMVSIIHLKDVNYYPLQTTLLGQGDIPLKTVLDHLPKSIEVIIEYPCGDHPVETLRRELNKLLKKECK